MMDAKKNYGWTWQRYCSLPFHKGPDDKATIMSGKHPVNLVISKTLIVHLGLWNHADWDHKDIHCPSPVLLTDILFYCLIWISHNDCYFPFFVRSIYLVHKGIQTLQEMYFRYTIFLKQNNIWTTKCLCNLNKKSVCFYGNYVLPNVEQ